MQEARANNPENLVFPKDGQEVDVYLEGGSDKWFVIVGYEKGLDGEGQSFDKTWFREPNMRNALTAELSEKWEYSEKELAQEQERELKPETV